MANINLPSEAYITEQPQAVNNQPKQINLPAEAYIQSKPEGVGNKIEANKNTLSSYISAGEQGVMQGLRDVFSTIDKATAGIRNILPDASSITGHEIPKTAQGVQDKYIKETGAYNADPDTNAHPFIAGAGHVAGNILATAPLGLLSGGGAAAADTAGAMGLGAVGRGVAGVAGEVGVNALQGGLMGAVLNNPNQGSDVINQKGLAQGAVFGGTIGAGTSALLGSYAKNLTNYQDYTQQLAKIGYKGPVFSTDVPANQGIYNSIKQSVVNGVIGKVPILNKAPFIGVQSARTAQENGIQDAVKYMADKFSNVNPETTQLQFKNAIINAKQAGENTIADASNNFRQILTANKITSHDLNNSLPIAQDLLKTNSKVLSDAGKDALESMSPSMSTNAILGSKDAAGLKQRIWAEYERLATDRVDTPSFNAATKLNDLYHSFNQDILNSLGDNQQAAQAFHNFNTITQGVKTIWDPRNSPMLAKALKDINGDANGMMTFFNKLQKGTLSTAAQSKYADILGDQGMNPVRDQILKNIFTKNMDNQTGHFDIAGFLNSIDKAPPNMIPGDLKDSLQGLQFLANKVTKGQAAHASGEMAAGAAAAIGGLAYTHPGIAGTLLTTGGAIGAITAHAPLKNALIGINQLSSKMGLSDGLSQYLINKASNYINRMGISIMNDAQGNVVLDKTGGK